MTRSRGLFIALAVASLLVPPPARGQVLTDTKLKQKLAAARDYVSSEDWRLAVQGLQELLDLPQDVFLQEAEKGPHGKPVEVLVGARVAADRLLAAMPEKGREAYEKLYGEKAAQLLDKARKESDKRLLADVAQRYLYTKAGPEAAQRLANLLVEDREYIAAAGAFDRLIGRVGLEKLEPLTLYNAARAYHKSNTRQDLATKAKVWKQLAAKAPNGLRVDGRDRTLKELEEDLKNLPAPKGLDIHDWPMFGGTPGRDGQGDGGAAFPQAQWRQSLFIENKEAGRFISNDATGVVKHLEMKGEAVIPAAEPVAVTSFAMSDGKNKPLLIFRTYEGVQARDLKAGAQEWRMPLRWSLEKLLADGQAAGTLTQWIQQFNQVNRGSVLIENSTIGTLSSDGRRVYCIDDLAVPPAGPPNLDRWGGTPPPGTGRFPSAISPGVRGNRLLGIGIAFGKLQWTLPPLVDLDDARFKPKHDFRDSHFLGAPLLVRDKLYVLNEKDQEIRLACIDMSKMPDRPQDQDVDNAVAWVQPLATAKAKLLDDYRRRINAAHIAYGDGVLVCPTNAGALVGVDPLTHSLLWAHVYGEEAPKAPAPPAPGRRIRPLEPALPSSEWKASAPVVQDGKVVFAPADGPELRCLSLRDGRLLWGAKAGQDDVYFAGVVAGRVLVVGKKDVRALALDDGKELWRLPTGLPSGRGAAADNVYYLPLKEAAFAHSEKGPGIFAIDVQRGKVVARTRCRKDPRTGAADVPGNLVFAGGAVVSQTATELAAYPLLKTKIGEMDELLTKNANDPRGLLERGELRLEQGQALGAAEDFRAALANKPDDDLRRKLRSRLYDALSELLERDFAAGEKFLKEYEELAREPVDPKLPQAARAPLEAERERRLLLLLALKGRGYEAQGKAAEALGVYLELAALKGWALVPADEPGLRARPDVWARGRIVGLVAAAKGEARQRLDEEIDRKGAALRKGPDVEALRAFVATFSPAFAAGRDAHLALAERLMDRAGRANLLEAEQLLLTLSAQKEDRQAAGRALEALARLLSRKGMLEDALAYYRTLARAHADTVIRDGKTGAQIFDGLKTDKRFLPYLGGQDEPQGRPRFKADEERDKNFGQQPQQMLYALDPLDDPLPYLRHRRVAVNTTNSHLIVAERLGNGPELDEQLRENFQQFLGVHPANPNGQTVPRFGYHSLGHLVVANLGQYVVAIDTITHRLLWEMNLVGAPLPGGGVLLYNANDEALQLMFPDNTFVTMGQSGPVTANYVCVATREGLSALDPLTGRTLWMRSDVPARCRLFGDDSHVYLVETDNTGTPTATRAFRARDGAAVNVPPFAPIFQKRQRVLGGQLLVADKDKDGVDLRLYDVQSGKDSWKQRFPAGTVMLNSEESDLAGTLGPDGRLTIIDLRQRKVVFVSLVAAEHLKNLQQAHLLADERTILVALHTGDPAKSPLIWSNLQANTGMRAITVNGMVYAFDRRTAKIRWYTQVENQQLMLDQWKELPALLFTARVTANNGSFRGNLNLGAIGIEAYDKLTGKLFYRQPTPGQPPLNPQGGQVYAINYDTGAGRVEMIAPNYKVTITRQAEADR